MRSCHRSHEGAPQQRDSQHFFYRRNDRFSRAVCIFHEQERSPGHDLIGRKGLSALQLPVQQHLPGKNPHAFCGRLSPKELFAEGIASILKVSRSQPSGRMGKPEEVSLFGLLSVRR
jgi:hypothetical protein